MEKESYFKGIATGVKSLATGLKTTMRELFIPKITEQYPENRNELMAEMERNSRFRGRLSMPHNDNNEHKCVGCGICQMNCPNDTITVKTKMIETEDGRKKKVLDQYIYDQGICMYCMICVRVCPHGAIDFVPEFEGAVFDREKLKLQLNAPGSKVAEKAKPKLDPAMAAKIAAAKAKAAARKAATPDTQSESPAATTPPVAEKPQFSPEMQAKIEAARQRAAARKAAQQQSEPAAAPTNVNSDLSEKSGQPTSSTPTSE